MSRLNVVLSGVGMVTTAILPGPSAGVGIRRRSHMGMRHREPRRVVARAHVAAGPGVSWTAATQAGSAHRTETSGSGCIEACRSRYSYCRRAQCSVLLAIPDSPVLRVQRERSRQGESLSTIPHTPVMSDTMRAYSGAHRTAGAIRPSGPHGATVVASKV